MLCLSESRETGAVKLKDKELEDRIEALVRDKYPRLKLTQEDIAQMIFADVFDRRHVSRACRRLVDENRLIQEGRGVANNPFTYRPHPGEPLFKRRSLETGRLK
jgi:hypothetical protein